MPSESETLGFVVLEAMASGIPVVSVAAGGLVDLIEKNKTGFLFAPDSDMIEFSKCINELAVNSTLCEVIGNNGRACALQWSWQNATSILRNYQYRAAIKLHGIRRRGWFSSSHNKTSENEILAKLRNRDLDEKSFRIER